MPDSRGRFQGRLHLFRDSEWCFDLVMLLAESTPAAYRRYLEAREYGYIVAGRERVDLPAALEEIGRRFRLQKLRVDSGRLLTAVLLKEGLVDEISLLLDPVLVGTAGARLFRSLELSSPVPLKLVRCEPLPDGLVHLLYEVQAKA